MDDGLHAVMPYVMPKRTDAEVSLTQKFDVTELCAYMERKNSEQGGRKLKLFHAFCTAVARMITLRPKLNVFVSGRRYWKRKDVTMSFVAKRKFADEAEELLIFLNAKPDMCIDDISAIITGDVDHTRKESSNDIDKSMNFVGKLPRIVLEILFKIIRFLEYLGMMPRSLMKGDPNYSTVLLSNLGSIRCGAPYHHLNNYGTCSIMITIGTLQKERFMMEDGVERERDMLEATFTVDERIADGFYFAKSLRIIKYLLENPEALGESLSTPVPVEL